MEKKYDILEATEDAAKFGYSLGVFPSRFFYQLSGINALKSSMDYYMASRFEQRLEYFTYEHDKLSTEQKQTFYKSLEENHLNINYLYTFIEKTRISTYDIHAKILAYISASLIKNNSLNYYESTLIANLDTLTEYDILEAYKILSQYEFHESSLFNNYEYAFINEEPEHHYVYNKLMQIGIILDGTKMQDAIVLRDSINSTGSDFFVGEFTRYFIKIIKEILNTDKC